VSCHKSQIRLERESLRALVNIHTCYGLCGAPARLKIAMLTAYFDESGIHNGDHLCVVAGFIGDEAQWGAFAADWIPAIHPRPHLHMKKLRWKQHPESVADTLAKLGPIPERYNLKPVFAGLWQRDYDRFMKGKIRPKYVNPYIACAMGCMLTVMDSIAGTDHVLFVFDRQDVHRKAIDRLNELVYKLMDFDPRVENVITATRPRYGSKLSKNVCLDPADFLAFEIREHHIDHNSFKAAAGASIMGTKPMYGNVFSSEDIEDMANKFIAAGMVPGGGVADLSDETIAGFMSRKQRNHLLGRNGSAKTRRMQHE
jgi:hypothetical protein